MLDTLNESNTHREKELSNSAMDDLKGKRVWQRPSLIGGCLDAAYQSAGEEQIFGEPRPRGFGGNV